LHVINPRLQLRVCFLIKILQCNYVTNLAYGCNISINLLTYLMLSRAIGGLSAIAVTVADQSPQITVHPWRVVARSIGQR